MDTTNIISLRTMMDCATRPENSGLYVFHGSITSLVPGRDMLVSQPGRGGILRPISAGNITVGLRYAMERASGEDMIFFMTNEYRIAVRPFSHDGWTPRAHWVNGHTITPTVTPGYLYMLSAHLFKKRDGIAMATVDGVPILSVALITPQTLKEAGFALDYLVPGRQMRFIQNCMNDNAAIRARVLPRLVYRGRGIHSR